MQRGPVALRRRISPVLPLSVQDQKVDLGLFFGGVVCHVLPGYTARGIPEFASIALSTRTRY